MPRAGFPRRRAPEHDDSALVDHLLAARDRERQQLAGRLHDGPQQTTTALRRLADSARHALDQGDVEHARSAMARVEELALEAADQLRQLTASLDPVVLERRGPMQALAALPGALGREHGIQARFTGPTELPGETSHRNEIVYAIAREFAVDAIERGSTAVAIALDLSGGLRLQIDAQGCDPPAGGTALILARRAREIGAALAIDGSGDAARLVLTAPAA